MSTQKANPKANAPFILASGSPRRRELLIELVEAFDAATKAATDAKAKFEKASKPPAKKKAAKKDDKKKKKDDKKKKKKK